MNFFDIIIIYLACGTPFGVFHIVNNRRWENRVLIQTIFITLFWFPFAISLLRKFVESKSDNSVLSKQEILRDEQITETKKNLELIFLKTKPKQSIFELREVFDRYVGLTLARENQDASAPENSLVFKIAGNESFELASKCYQRRNAKLLSFHQTLAGQDFLKLIAESVSEFPVDSEIENHALELVRLIEDEKTEKSLKTIFRDARQSANELRVSKTEKEKWITDLQKPSRANNLQVSMNRAGKITLPIKD